MDPSAASSGETDEVGAVIGAGGVAGGEAFGADRRGLSVFLSERSLGAALTAGARDEGSFGGTVDASICNGG